MAWALLTDTKQIDSVTFALPAVLDAGLYAVEISDQRATEVMLGTVRLQECLFSHEDLAKAEKSTLPLGRSHDSRLLNSRWPAMMGEVDAAALVKISQLIPPDSIAVEIGSRLGGSSKLILDSAPGIKRLYCIDSEWSLSDSQAMLDPYMDQLTEYWSIDRTRSCFDYAKELLQDYKQARLLALSSPYDFNWWTEPIDFIFEDSSHANPQLRDNLNFWVHLVKSGGIIAGHDYAASHWPDVAVEANRLRDMFGTQLNVQGSVWWMIKP